MVRCGSRGPVSMPSTSQIKTTQTSANHGQMATKTWRFPSRSDRDRSSQVDRGRVGEGVRRAWCRSETSIPTTTASDADHVATAGSLDRWNPLTKPHHAQITTTPNTRSALARTRTPPSFHSAPEISAAMGLRTPCQPAARGHRSAERVPSLVPWDVMAEGDRRENIATLAQ